MKKKPELSWEVFHVISTILNRFIKIQKDCGVSMSELYVLAFLKHSGRDFGGEKVVLRSEVTQLLKENFGYAPKRVTAEVSKLRGKRCIREHTLDSKEKKRIYGVSTGQKRSVVILAKGYEKIDEFTIKINEVYLDLTGPLLAAAFGEDNKLIRSIADWLLSEKSQRG